MLAMERLWDSMEFSLYPRVSVLVPAPVSAPVSAGGDDLLSVEPLAPSS